MNRTVAALVITLIALLTRGAQAQQEYKSESGSWSFTAPEGWNQIGFDRIKHREKLEREEYPEKVFTYIAGFTRGPMNTFSYPYILINRTEIDLTQVTYEDIEEGTNIADTVTNERDLALALYMQQAFAQNGAADRDRVRLKSWFEETDENGKEFRVTFHTFLGSTKSIQFECYDLKSNGEKNTPVFNEFVNSFKMKDDLKFVPTSGKSQFDKSNFRQERSSSRSGGSYRGGRYFGFGGVGLVIALLARWWVNKD